jgi:hypothetical protein
VNHGLALLRAGKTQDGIAELQRAQKQDPSIPHTWFNLGIAFKKDSQYDKAIEQFERMVTLVPGEAISHYNLGYLFKISDRLADAVREFELAATLNPNLAGPHFQLYNSYREAGRAEDAAREQALFQEIRKRQAGAAVPEDLDWSFYSEILDPVDPADAGRQRSRPGDRGRTAGGRSGRHPGVTTVDTDADGSGRDRVSAETSPVPERRDAGRELGPRRVERRPVDRRRRLQQRRLPGSRGRR